MLESSRLISLSQNGAWLAVQCEFDRQESSQKSRGLAVLTTLITASYSYLAIRRDDGGAGAGPAADCLA